MTIEFYQKALSDSAKAMLDSRAQLLFYAEQLGKGKVNSLAKQLIGKEYPSTALLDKSKKYYDKCEPGLYKAVHIASYVSDWRVAECIKDDDALLTISVVFIRDPKIILNSKLKLTDAEKRILKKLKDYYDVSPGRNSPYFSNSDAIDLGDKLSCLKHELHMVISLSWAFSINKILSEDFSSTTLKAVINLR